MRTSILCLVLAGFSGIAQASPVAQPNAEPRSLITRGLSHAFYPRQHATTTTTSASEPPPTKRQATTPPPPLTSSPSNGGGGAVNNANRTVTLAVIKGDTLGQIARLLNSGICNIAKLNNIPNPDFIEVGQVLQVPINVANPDNESCLNRGGAIPAPTAPAANGTATPPGGGGSKKTSKKTTTKTKTTRRRSSNLFSSGHGEES